jgi:DNA repair protein RecO (recombination protein O)
LNKREVGETDRICTLYTLEGGKIKSIAKGVRKSHAKLAASLENVTLADVTIVRTRGLGKITGSIIENNFTFLKSDYSAMLEVFSSLSLFDKLVDFENPDKTVFDLLKDYLEAVDDCCKENKSEKCVLLNLGFVVKLLRELGYALEVNACVVCGKKLFENDFKFSASHGGTLCGQCCQANQQEVIPIRPNAIKLMRLFLQNKMNALIKIQATREDCDSARLAVDEFLRWNS